MKQKLIFITILSVFTLFYKTSQAQEFLSQNKVWSDYYHSNRYNLFDETGKFMGFTTAKVTTWHKVGPDSLIDGTLYKQILSSRDSLMENWSLGALMREEGSKVFRYYPIGKTETLFYDFGMQPGDTLFDVNGYVATILQSVRDTIMDRTRKIFIFKKCEYSSYYQVCGDCVESAEIWIEGIGALRGGIFRSLCYFMTGCDYSIGYSGLICYSENGEPVYQHPDFEKCYYNEIKPIGGVDIPEIIEQKDYLYQNVPNPFTGQTEIKYFVFAEAKEAYICIFDMQGKMLQRISAAPGHNSVMIQGSSLTAGMYLYSLIVDGHIVDTKRMVLTR